MSRFLNFLLLICCSSGVAIASKPVEISLEQAFRDPGLLVSIRSNGGYCRPNGLSIRILNASCQTYSIAVRPGLVFRPDDRTYQDLLIASTQNMLLAPDSETVVKVQTFCAKASAWGPDSNRRYSFLGKATPPLQSVLSYMMANKLLNSAGQHAVWCFTDNHNPSGIYDPNIPEKTKQLAAIVARVKGVKPPEYFLTYKPSGNSGSVFNPQVDNIIVDLHWTAEPRNMRTHVYNADGTRYKGAKVEEYISSEGHRLHVVFPLATVPSGAYYVKVHDDENRVYAYQDVVIE